MRDLRIGRYVQAITVGLLISAGPAFADGGFPQPAFPAGGFVLQSGEGSAAYAAGPRAAYSWSAETIEVTGAGFAYTGTVSAAALATVNRKGVGTAVALGGYGSASGNVPMTVTSTNFADSFTKGSNSMTFGESVLTVTVVVNGRSYVVATEVAEAFSRATQFGSSTATFAGGTADGVNFSSTQVVTSKSGSR